MTNEFQIKWSWVKGHSTDVLNNEVDLIAREAANFVTKYQSFNNFAFSFKFF